MSTFDGKTTFASVKQPPRVTQRIRRVPTKFEIWAWSHVLSFQIGLTGLYIGLFYAGIASTIATLPALIETSPQGTGFYWGVALTLGAGTAAVGSIGRKKWFEVVEFIGSALVSLAVGSIAGVLTALAYGLGDAQRIAGAAFFTALAIPLLVRTLWLASQLRRK